MNFGVLLDFTLNEGDKRLLIVLLVFALLFLLIIGLFGVLIRFLTNKFAGRMDYEIQAAVRYRVIHTPEQLWKYGLAKNRRRFFKEASIPVLIALFSLFFWLGYSSITGIWGRNYFGEFGTVLFQWNWGDADSYVNFWGMTLLAKFPPLTSSPHLVADYWVSYVLVPLWLVAIGWYLVDIWRYASRISLLRRRMHTVFEKGLDDFNYFDGQGTPPVPPSPGATSNQQQ